MTTKKSTNSKKPAAKDPKDKPAKKVKSTATPKTMRADQEPDSRPLSEAEAGYDPQTVPPVPEKEAIHDPQAEAGGCEKLIAELAATKKLLEEAELRITFTEEELAKTAKDLKEAEGRITFTEQQLADCQANAGEFSFKPETLQRFIDKAREIYREHHDREALFFMRLMGSRILPIWKSFYEKYLANKK